MKFVVIFEGADGIYKQTCASLGAAQEFIKELPAGCKYVRTEVER